MSISTIQYKGHELLPVKRDLVFKAVFIGDGDLELLASLVSSILEMDIKADDIEVTNSELPPISVSGKLSRLDIRIKTKDRKHINVEIQLGNEHNMDKRSLYYLSRLYIEQMVAGMEFSELCPAIAINILDFAYLPSEKYHNRYRMRETQENHELTDVFEVNFIELPKVSREANQTLKDLWARYIKADSEEELEMLAKENPVLEKAVKKQIYISADEQLRYEIFMREKAELDYLAAMKTSRRKGKEEGLEEGRREVHIAAVRKLIKMGMSEADIAEALDLPISQVMEIKTANPENSADD